MEKPWVEFYDPMMQEENTCPAATMYELLEKTSLQFPNVTALIFEDYKMSFKELYLQIHHVARKLQKMGWEKGEVATICLPNIPQAAILFYSLNKMGLIANMVHPKTPALELKEYMTSTKSRYLLVLDAFLPLYLEIIEELSLEKVIIAQIGDYLSPGKRFLFYVSKGRKIASLSKENRTKDRFIFWKELVFDFSSKGFFIDTHIGPAMLSEDPAIYLHSGGTTGSPKTVVLSSRNMNAIAILGWQIVNIPDPFATKKAPNVSMATILPLFHGFGLCMGLHTMMVNGITAVLVPQFSPDALAKIILKHKTTYIAAVPTLFEGILKSKKLQRQDLSFLKCCFCGGDSLSQDLKMRFENFVRQRGSTLHLREGYGLTESVCVCAVNPEKKSKPGSVGLPLPGILLKIVEENSEKIVPTGKMGEICIAGPTVMLEYLNDAEATKFALRKHQDGKIWLHTGDFGSMDEGGYFYFTQRLKRIIKVSGVPVFPTQIEEIISQIEGIERVCVVAKPDSYRMHVVKAIIITQKKWRDIKEETDFKAYIQEYCSKHLIKYACPVEIEFREHLPLTLVGKVDYLRLEAEEVS